MKRVLMMAGLLLIAVPVSAEPENALASRARQIMDDGALELPIQGQLLAQYADSLRHLDVVLAAKCLERGGIAAFRANQLDSALARWQRGVSWARQAGENQAESSLLNALAIGHTARGDVETALPVYDRALELREALADTAGLARTWGNLAQAYANMRRTSEALAATVEAEKWLALADNTTGRIANSLRKGQMLRAMGRLDEALFQNRETVDLAGRKGDQNAQGLAALELGEVLLDLERPREALPRLEEALDLFQASRDDFQAMFAEQSIIASLLMSDQADQALARVRQVIPVAEEAGQVPLLTVLRRMEGQALFRLGQIASAEVALEQSRTLFEKRWQDLEDGRSRAGIFAASGDVYAALARLQLSTGRVEEAFLTVERGRAPGFLARVGGRLASVEQLQAELRRTASALILFNDPGWDPLVAFVLDGRQLRYVELGNPGPMASDARAALGLLAAGESLETCGPALERLETRLARPLMLLLDDQVKRLAVVPPSFLSGFPLGLLSGQDTRPWSYLPSASALLFLGERAAPTGGVLALADPESPASSASPDPLTGRLPVSTARAQAGVPLPQARAEIDAVAERPADQRVGSQATGAALRIALQGPLAVLHLATHAVVDPVDGGRSAVVLAGAEGVDAVTAQEIAAFDFAGDLVVLSGCSTFGQHRVLGEGWFGLPRSFLAAGARSVVSTLWDVDDTGARIFVTAFYAALRAGSPRDEALQRARQVCRDEGLPPRDWAAFVLSGVGADRVESLATAPISPNFRPPGLLLLVLSLVLAVILLVAFGLPRRR